ncbi:MAG: carbon monoxide dehydrogenase subunit G [Gammaproteobacteria bacterium]|jgi:carbon monoxide dehydrogenase subunit G
MVTLNEEMTIASPVDAVWPLLSDPAVVAGCIPGAEMSANSDDDVWRGSIRVKFGPTIATFKGEATLAFDGESKRITMDGRGIDGRGASRALANMVVELHPDDTLTDSCRLKVEGGFTVTGPLETFVNAGGVHVARALLGEFCTNIAAAVTQADGAPAGAEVPSADDEAEDKDERTVTRPERDSQPDSATQSTAQATTPAAQQSTVARSSPTPASPATRPAELSASGLLWRTIVSWLKSLFGKGK